MAKPETITIDDVKYIRADSVPKAPNTDGKLRIVILNRGWNLVGYFTQEGSQCKLTNAAVIRRWGTTKGLGQIAENGVTKATILDKCPDVRFHELGMVASIDCVEEKWHL